MQNCWKSWWKTQLIVISSEGWCIRSLWKWISHITFPLSLQLPYYTIKLTVITTLTEKHDILWKVCVSMCMSIPCHEARDDSLIFRGDYFCHYQQKWQHWLLSSAKMLKIPYNEGIMFTRNILVNCFFPRCALISNVTAKEAISKSGSIARGFSPHMIIIFKSTSYPNSYLDFGLKGHVHCKVCIISTNKNRWAGWILVCRQCFPQTFWKQLHWEKIFLSNTTVKLASIVVFIGGNNKALQKHLIIILHVVPC